MDTIDFDLPCERCGYNLRTLPGEGICPECGEVVETSLSAWHVRTGDLGQLRAMGQQELAAIRSGLTLAVATSAICTSGLAYPDLEPPLHGLANRIAWAVPPTCAYVCSCYAARRIVRDPRHPWLAAFIRAIVVSGIVALALRYLNYRFFDHYVGYASWPTVGSRFDRIVAPFGAFAALLWPVTVVLTWAWIARLAWLADRLRLAAASIAVALIGFLPAAAAFLIAQDGRAGSGEVLVTLSGPTGSWPLPWLILGQVSRHPSGWVPAWTEGLFALGIAVQSALVIALLSLRKTVTRAIRLGGLPAASSRSSPSPRPPA